MYRHLDAGNTSWGMWLSRIQRSPEARDGAPDRLERLRAYTRDINLRVASWEARLALLLTPLYWLVDAWQFTRAELLYGSALYRGFTCIAALATLTLVAWLRRTGTRAVLGPIIAAGMVHAAIIGAGVARLTGVGHPLFSGFCLLPFLGAPLLGGPAARVAGTALLMASALTGYFILRPDQLHHPLMPITIGLFSTSSIVALLVGHATTWLLEQSFLRALALADATRELATSNERLESRVAERTREVSALAGYVDAAREAERATLARELHDELGQILTSMRLELALIPAADRRGATGAVVARLDGLIEQSLGAVHDVVAALRPRVLDELGLSASVEWLARRHEARTGADCAWSVDLDERQLDPEHATALFRVVQEALTNVARHARARQVRVEVDLDGAWVRARVRDDGIGFAPRDGAQRRFGILGMRERARRLGGDLDLDSEPGGGTELTLRLPRPVDTTARAAAEAP